MRALEGRLCKVASYPIKRPQTTPIQRALNEWLDVDLMNLVMFSRKYDDVKKSAHGYPKKH